MIRFDLLGTVLVFVFSVSFLAAQEPVLAGISISCGDETAQKMPEKGSVTDGLIFGAYSKNFNGPIAGCITTESNITRFGSRFAEKSNSELDRNFRM